MPAIRTAASTVLPRIDKTPRRYACGNTTWTDKIPCRYAYGRIGTVLPPDPTDPTDPGGGPAGGGLTKRLGASLFKRREWKLGETGVLGGMIKNGRLLVTRITSPGRAIWHTVRPDFFFYTDYLLLYLQIQFKTDLVLGKCGLD